MLLIEDDHQLRRTLHRQLEERGYEVTSAYDGPDAQRVIGAGFEPHVLVTDLDLPGASGQEVVSVLRLQQREVKVLFISGRPDLIAQVALRTDTAALDKPFTIGTLADTIETLLEPARRD